MSNSEKQSEPEKNSKKSPIDEGAEYPVLALRDLVVFPLNTASLFVGRQSSLKAAMAAYQFSSPLVLLTQKNPDTEEPGEKDLYSTGVLADIKRYVVMPDGTINLAVAATERVKVKKFYNKGDYNTVTVTVDELFPDIDEDEAGVDEDTAMARMVQEKFTSEKLNIHNLSEEALLALHSTRNPTHSVAAMLANLPLSTAERQEFLETPNFSQLLSKLLTYLMKDRIRDRTEAKVRHRVKDQMEKNQREYYLNEQMKAIQKELNGSDSEDDEIATYRKRIEASKLSKEARTKALQELHKLQMGGVMNAEGTIIRNYLDWLLDLPWGKNTPTNKDLDKAIKILDEDHFGLTKVKERIVEFLAVQARSQKLKSPILCLVGAPGVGKTSMGKSIARATGRKFIRTALGGMRDEAEIRGHRRTYIGAMPGKIIQCIKKAGVSNPLFLLDEIDKLGNDWRGDPSAALLEVLDPEQNSTFNDHYLDVDFDLSNVMFVTTANSLNMPRPLLDRMEIIHIDGYTEQEKLEIAKRHLLPKVFSENAIQPHELMITDAALLDIIRFYTSESGVRSLERQLATIARKCAKDILLNHIKDAHITVEPKDLEKYLGVKIFHYGEREKENHIGVTTGLAWTETGGDILFIEAVDMPGKGVVKQTGKLGDVMKESIDTAYSVVRSRALSLGIDPEVFEKTDVHVHVPEGATPKDGPSAGITMFTTLVSVFTRIPVRSDVAMTGEITLQGRVLPIGGLKEKLLSALRGGIKTVIVPKANEKDLADLPEIIQKEMKIVLVENVSEVLEIALERKIDPSLQSHICVAG
jgi:ATP-dependent Lon protease